MSLLRLTPHHCLWCDSICFGLHTRKEQLAGDTTERGLSHCKARLLDRHHWTLPLLACYTGTGVPVRVGNKALFDGYH